MRVLRSLAFGAVCALVSATLQLGFQAQSAYAAIISESATSSTITKTAQQVDDFIASAPMPNLSVTVSQTRDLTSQAVLVSWTGGVQSERPSGDSAGTNFLQVAQCWGDDPNDATMPDRTTCQYGLQGVVGSTRDNFMNSNAVDDNDDQFTVQTSSVGTAYTSIPFRAPTGETVTSISQDENGVKHQDELVDPNNNQFFTNYTNNQVRWAGSDAAGAGFTKFEIQTVMQSPGLGCGTPIVTGTTAVGSSCWLVVIPRGRADNGQGSISKSGLFWDSWKHAIAFKLDFRPVGVRCTIGAAEKQLSGSELIASAIASWQPQLCSQPGGSAYVLSTGSEADALTTELNDPNAPLAFTSSPAVDDSAKVLVYAPVAVSGIVVSFAIDRSVTTRGKVPAEYTQKNLTPFETINITPRLLAKLLTASYTDALPPADKSHIGYVSYLDPGHNPRNLTRDPDFLAVNDVEWKYNTIIGVGISDATTPIGRSDLAERVWQYILSDDEARAWMNGEPDPWGMVVNPYFSTNEELNPVGTALQLPRPDFPKADPIEKPDTTVESQDGTGAINLVAWRPYVSDFEAGAYRVLRGDQLALGAWNYGAIPPGYTKSVGDIQGYQKMIALSTAPSAAKYQTFTAALRNPAGTFVAPTRDSMASAMAAATPSKLNSQVYEFDFCGDSARGAISAYPLTVPIYAAVNASLLSAELRQAYATVIAFAATRGQVPGSDLGQLPPGYSPLSQGFVEQAMKVSSVVLNGVSQSSDSGSTIEPPTETPTEEPSSGPLQVVLSGITPADPIAVPQQSAVGYAFAVGSIASLVYPRLRRRKAKS